MCISDWSSDVCSSDLEGKEGLGLVAYLQWCETDGDGNDQQLQDIKGKSGGDDPVRALAIRGQGQAVGWEQALEEIEPPPACACLADGQGGAMQTRAGQMRRAACRERVCPDG